MGNTIPSCCNPNSSSPVKLFFWDGTTKMLTGKKLAGELMFQFPDRIICHADSFYIGHPIQALSIDDRLVKGETYFILPVNPFAGQILSTTSLATLSPAPKCKLPISSCNNPFQYIKGSNGRMMMKVSPEFMMRIISGGGEQGCNPSKSPLCSTPELWKQYKLLVGSREQRPNIRIWILRGAEVLEPCWDRAQCMLLKTTQISPISPLKAAVSLAHLALNRVFNERERRPNAFPQQRRV
ncbi:uncharacterized protein LOC131250597 [Magnolia sinica]|uniref:uncharacterized protein LOC131250597 n=1 Tax=Magnolia sinica TaxID=86752 RepID=UPI002659ED39|nr:uncharacterized protein LOC131250597 [Magnolia sinica]